MAPLTLTVRMLVALAICAPVAALGAQPASGQERDPDRRVQPPTELLREYPFRQGVLRSRRDSQARRAAEPPVADTSADTGAITWLLVLAAAMGASALVALAVAGRRLTRANTGGRGPQEHEPAAATPSQPPITPRQAPSRNPGKSRPPCSFAVVNQKGGVGKTTVSLTVGVAAVRRGSRVLVVDLDPQASATTVLAREASGRPTVADAMLNPDTCSLDATVVRTDWGLDLAPSSRALRSAETREAGDAGVLSEQLASVGDYDLMLIDCPPSLGFLTHEALGAVSRALVVTEPTYLALQAIDELADTMQLVSAERNPSLALGGVVLNRAETTAEHKRSIAEVQQVFGSRVLEPHIPKRAVLQDAMRRGVPPQDLRSHYADEISELFDALAEQLEAVPAKRFAPDAG